MKIAKWLFLIVVCVKWVDITGDTGWVTKDELLEAARITSCGIFVKEDDDFLWLAMDAAEDGMFNSTGVFPKGVIQSETRFNLGDEEDNVIVIEERKVK